MTGKQLCEAVRNDNTAKVSMLLCTHIAQSFINYQDAHGATPLYIAAAQGHAFVTKQLLAAHCNVDLQDNNGLAALQLAEEEGHAGIATLIRNTKGKGVRMFYCRSDPRRSKSSRNMLTGR